MWSNNLAKIGACALPVLFASAALAVASADEAGTDPVAADADRIALNQLSPDLANNVAAFRHPQRSADVIPGDPVAKLEQLGDARPGENPELSRRLDVGDGSHFYVWPERDGICRSAYGAGACSPVWLLEHRGVLLGTYEHADALPRVHVYGVARDGIDSIHFKLADGTSVVASVRDNGLMITLPTRPVLAWWQNPDGSAGGETFGL